MVEILIDTGAIMALLSPFHVKLCLDGLQPLTNQRVDESNDGHLINIPVKGFLGAGVN